MNKVNNYFKELETIDSKIDKKSVEKHEIICTIEELETKEHYFLVTGNNKKASAIENRINKYNDTLVIIDEQINSLKIKKDELSTQIPSDYLQLAKK